MESDPDFDRQVPKPLPRPRFRLLNVFLALAVVVILVALMLPATRSARPSARRLQCTNNLRQIVLALSNYEARYGALPPARTVDASGRPLHSWRTLILPFLDQQDLYQSIDLAKPWDDGANARAREAMPGVFRCPELGGPADATTYLAVVGTKACFLPDQPRRLADIKDGHAACLMVIEAGPSSAVHWMAPRDGDEALILDFGPEAKWNHSGGTNAAFVDGSVRFLMATTPGDAIRGMMTIDDGGPKSPPD
jgi:prepilin-type processing-associated H-X9-DG protein